MSKTLGSTHEDTFNQALGQVIRSLHANWSANPGCVLAERKGVVYDSEGNRKRVDVLILDKRSPPVAIECSFGASDANDDASKRLGCMVGANGPKIQTTISLLIPPVFETEQIESIVELLRDEEPIQYAIYQRTTGLYDGIQEDKVPRRWPSRGFVDGTVSDMISLIPAAALPKETIESVADRVARHIVTAASTLGEALNDNQCARVSDRVRQRSAVAALRTAMVLWLNALLTQQRLSEQGVSDIRPVPVASHKRPLPSQVADVWRSIQEINWRSIFEPAIDVLEKAGSIAPRPTSDALHSLVRAVELIEVARLGLHINVGAELFPKLAEDRKQSAAFYTRPSVAEFLAVLTIKEAYLFQEEWASEDLFRQRRVADLACGTGTLLRAAYRRIAGLHDLAGGTAESLRVLHATAMERGVIGTDISPIAAHLTVSSLTALGQGDPYSETQIGWVDVGGTNALTGSLEYFVTPSIANLFDVGSGTSEGDEESEAISVEVPDGEMDWIIMNPPYSRTRGKQAVFDVAGISGEEREACQKRWGVLVKQEPVDRRAGLAASFLALARKKCKVDGRIGFVLPLTAASANSWQPTRQMIEERFTEIVAVAVAGGLALGRRAMSDDTNMEEMQLVCTKKPTHNPDGSADNSKTETMYFVTLNAPLDRVGESSEIAKAIDSVIARIGEGRGSFPVVIGDDEVGKVHVFITNCDGSPWHPLGVVHPEIAVAANELLNGSLRFDDFVQDMGVRMTTIGDLFEVGPTHDLIGHNASKKGVDARGAFAFYYVSSDTDSIGRDRSLWGADSRKQNRLVVLPTHKGISPIGVGSPEQRRKMRSKRGTLFYARGMRWTSQAVLCGTTTRPVMGGRAWTALINDDIKIRRAFALWANSTLGMLIHWTQGQRTQTGRSPTQVDAIKMIPCPDLTRLPESKLNLASDFFNALSTACMLPACQSYRDQSRQAIDDAVVELFSLRERGKDALRTIQWLWCNEPSVHGQNQTALRFLEECSKLGEFGSSHPGRSMEPGLG